MDLGTGAIMRFFFDYRTKDRALYDYRGDDFRNSQAAIEFAAAIAEMLKQSLDDDWMGWRVEVRNPEGVKFLSLPVGVAGKC